MIRYLVLVVFSFCMLGLWAQALNQPRPFRFNRSGGRGRTMQGNRQPAQNASQAQFQSQTQTPSSAEAYASAADNEEQDSDLNFVGADLQMVFKVYSTLVGKTILRDPQITEKQITLKSEKGQKLTKEDQIEAIEMVLEMNEVHLEPYGEKFIRAVPRGNASKEAPTMVEAETLGMTGKVVSMLIRLNFIGYEEALKIVQEVASGKAKLQGIERNNSILVTDTELNIRRMLEIVRRIDIESKPTEDVKIYQIHNASASEIQQVLQKIVEESQKELEKAGAGTTRQQPNMMGGRWGHRNTLLRRPGAANNQQPAPAATTSSILSNISDADRGLIRGKVVILSDERSNKLVIITSPANHRFFKTLIDELDVATTPETEVKVYRLKYADAEEVSDMINDLIGNAPTSKNASKQNQNQNSRAGGTVSVTSGAKSSPASANKRSNEPGTGELSKDNTTVLADKRINGLVVMTRKELVPVVESIIESMDVKLSQVLIETVIIEVTLGEDLNSGIDWVQRGRQKGVTYQKQLQKVTTGYDENDEPITQWKEVDVPVYGIVRDNFVNNGHYGLGGGGGSSAASALLSTVVNVATNSSASYFGGATPIGSGINYILKSDKLNLAAVVQASKTDNRAKYIASPIVMTVDNKEATIEATESRKFYSGSTSTSGYGSSNPTVTYNYSDKDIGIKIKVTPKINPNGTVMLEIEEEYSQLGAGQSVLVSGSNGGAGKENIDTALTRKMSADILLENMQTVVLGGLTETFTQEEETGIPILKDIPWIGKWLFGSVFQSENRKELLVFMTPYVLNDGESTQLEAIRRKKALSDPSPWEDHGWSASKLADPVAKKELMRRLKDEWAKQDEERKTKIAIEKMKVERAKKLEQLSAQEREVWLKMYKDELDKEKQEELEEKMLDEDSQAELKALAEKIKKDRLAAAEKEIDKADEMMRAENERARLDKAKSEKTAEKKAEEK